MAHKRAAQQLAFHKTPRSARPAMQVTVLCSTHICCNHASNPHPPKTTHKKRRSLTSKSKKASICLSPRTKKWNISSSDRCSFQASGQITHIHFSKWLRKWLRSISLDSKLHQELDRRCWSIPLTARATAILGLPAPKNSEGFLSEGVAHFLTKGGNKPDTAAREKKSSLALVVVGHEAHAAYEAAQQQLPRLRGFGEFDEGEFDEGEGHGSSRTGRTKEEALKGPNKVSRRIWQKQYLVCVLKGNRIKTVPLL